MICILLKSIPSISLVECCSFIKFVDIDYTGNQHFPYLLNIVCFNKITDSYMTCGHAFLNHQDGVLIGKALSVLNTNVKKYGMT